MADQTNTPLPPSVASLFLVRAAPEWLRARQPGHVPPLPAMTPEKETLFQTRWLALHRIGTWDYVKRPNADACVGILALTPDDEVVLVEQFRIPIQQATIELPAGLAGDEDAHAGESLADTARRELLEETGFAADRVELLLASPTSSGMTSEFTHLFLATDLTRVEEGGGVGDESITVHLVPRPGLRTWLRDRGNEGLAIDYKIHAALWAAEAHLS